MDNQQEQVLDSSREQKHTISYYSFYITQKPIKKTLKFVILQLLPYFWAQEYVLANLLDLI